MITNYTPGRRESVIIPREGKEENESGFGEDAHVSTERPEAINGVKCVALWTSGTGAAGRGRRWIWVGNRVKE